MTVKKKAPRLTSEIMIWITCNIPAAFQNNYVNIVSVHNLQTVSPICDNTVCGRLNNDLLYVDLHTYTHTLFLALRSENVSCSVQFSRSVVSDSLWRHESQHARPPCPSPTPGVHSNSRPSRWWCHPAISSSVVPFSSCPQSLPASESFPMSQLFAWGGQSIGISALASFLPKKTQDWSPLEWTGWISCSSRDSQESSPTPQFKSINSSALSFLHRPTLTSIHDHWRNHSLD